MEKKKQITNVFIKINFYDSIRIGYGLAIGFAVFKLSFAALMGLLTFLTMFVPTITRLPM